MPVSFYSHVFLPTNKGGKGRMGMVGRRHSVLLLRNAHWNHTPRREPHASGSTKATHMKPEIKYYSSFIKRLKPGCQCSEQEVPSSPHLQDSLQNLQGKEEAIIKYHHGAGITYFPVEKENNSKTMEVRTEQEDREQEYSRQCILKALIE